MALEKTWEHVIGYAPSSASAALLCKNVPWFWSRVIQGDGAALTFKDLVNASIASGSMLGGWKPIASCDGSGGAGSFVTGGSYSSPVTDKWAGAGNTFDSTKIVFAAAGSNHSYGWWESPPSLGGTGQKAYLGIDCNQAGATSLSVFLAHTAPTGGSATAIPTSTDQVQLDTNPATFIATTTNTHHITAQLSTDGIFRMFQSRDGVGAINSYFAVEAFADKIAGDLWPYAMCLYHVASPTGGNWPLSPMAMSWNSLSQAVRNPNCCWRGRSADGTIITNLLPEFPCYFEGNGSTVSPWYNNYASNPQAGAWDNADPVVIKGVIGQAPGRRGRLYDMRYSYARKNSAPIVMGDGTYDSVKGIQGFGDVWVSAPAGMSSGHPM